MTMDIYSLQAKLNQLVDRHFTDQNVNEELKQNLDLSEFGLSEPFQVDQFLRNTPQGKALVTLIGQTELLEEDLLEQKIEHNIEETQRADSLKKFLLFETAMVIKASKEHIIEMNHQAETSLSHTLEVSKNIHHAIVSTPVNDTLSSYHQTLEQLQYSQTEYQALIEEKAHVKGIDNAIESLLHTFQIKKDFSKLSALLLEDESDSLTTQKKILKVKLNKKRSQLLSNDINHSNKSLSIAHLTVDQLLFENLLLLSSPEELEQVQEQIKKSTTQEHFNACFSDLQTLDLITEHQVLDFEKQLTPLLLKIEKENDPVAFIHLEKFKKSFMAQYANRTLLDSKGQPLDNQNKLNSAFYSKPTTLNAFFSHETLYFVDTKSFKDHILQYENHAYLTHSEMRLEERQGTLYLLLPNQSLDTMTVDAKLTASKSADKAKTLALNACTLAKKYALNTQGVQSTLADIENRVLANEEVNRTLQLTLKEKRKLVERCPPLSNAPQIASRAPTLAPTAPTLVPQKKIDFHQHRQTIVEQLQKDYKNKHCYSNQEMNQINQKIIINLQNLPTETRSLVFEKYRGSLPVISQLDQPSTTKPMNYSPLEIAKQQIELQRMMRDINQSLNRESNTLTPRPLMPTHEYSHANNFTPNASSMGG